MMFSETEHGICDNDSMSEVVIREYQLSKKEGNICTADALLACHSLRSSSFTTGERLLNEISRFGLHPATVDRENETSFSDMSPVGFLLPVKLETRLSMNFLEK
jgi:hypothetical protein